VDRRPGRHRDPASHPLLGGSGVGLVSAPATEAIMGVVPKAKAGVGCVVDDACSEATRCGSPTTSSARAIEQLWPPHSPFSHRRR
jgi:hypothetical protein